MDDTALYRNICAYVPSYRRHEAAAFYDRVPILQDWSLCSISRSAGSVLFSGAGLEIVEFQHRLYDRSGDILADYCQPE